MSAPVAGIRYHYDHTSRLWVAPGRVSLPGVSDDRTILVRGAYEPDDTNTGPLPSYTSFTQVEAGSSGQIDLRRSDGVFDGTHYVVDGCQFWGTVALREPGIKVTNFLMHGGAPGTGSKAGIKSFGTGYYHGIFENGTIDPYAWYESGRYPMMTALTYINRPGVHGGDVELRWVRIRNCEDGIGWVQNEDLGSVDTGNTGYNNGAGWTVPAGQRFTIVDRCFIDRGSYVNGADYQTAMGGGQTGGYPHCDAFQFNTGRNLWITGSRLGNTRTPAAYQSWPTDPQNPPLSLDMGTSAFMVQQEGTTNLAPGLPKWLDNVIVEDSFAAGGVATFNMILKNGNNLAGLTFRRIKVYERKTGWGTRMEDGALVSSGTNARGLYVAGVPNQLSTTWQDITVKETGALIPFAYG